MRNTIIWSALLICAFSAKAQSWETLSDSAYKCINVDLDKANTLLIEAENLMDENILKADTNYIYFLYRKGIIERYKNDDYEKAQEYLSNSVHLSTETTVVNSGFLSKLYYNYAGVIMDLDYDKNDIINAFTKSIEYNHAQKIVDFYKLTWSYFYMGQVSYDYPNKICKTSKNHFKKALELYNVNDESHFIGWISNHNLSYCTSNEIKQAEFTFNAAIAYSKLEPDSIYNHVVNLKNSCYIFIENKKFDKAKEVLDFGVSNIIVDKESIEFGDMLYEYGKLYYEQDAFKTAIEYYQKSIEIFNTKLPSNHINLYNSNKMIGLCYYLDYQNVDAIKYYKYAIEIALSNVDLSEEYLNQNYETLAGIYDEVGNNILAKKYRNLSVGNSNNSPETGDDYSDLVDLYLANQDYQNAYEAIVKAEELYLIEDDYESAYYLYILAIDLAAQNMIFSTEQMDYFISLMEIIKDKVDESLHPYIDLMNGYSLFIKTEYKSTIQVMKKLIPKLHENTEELSVALLYLGISEALLGDVDNSVIHLDECLVIKKHIYGIDNPSLIDTYTRIALIHNLARPETAMRYIVPALKIIDNHELNGTIVHASLLGMYGTNQIKNNNDEGLTYLKEAIDIFETFEFNPNYHYYYSNLLVLAGYHIGRSEIDEAIIYLNQTEAVLEEYAEDKSSIEYADLYLYIGNAALYSDNFQLAIENYDLALNIYTHTFGEGNPIIDQINTHKGFTLYLLGNKQAGLDLISKSNNDGFANGFMYMLTYDQNQDEALSYLLNGLENLKDYISTTFSTMSDSDKNKFLSNLKSNFENTNSHLLSSQIDTEFLKAYLSNRFYYRGLLMANSNLDFMNENSDSIVDKIKLNRTIISSLYESNSTNEKYLNELIAETNKLERLNSFSSTTSINNKITYDNIYTNLQENEIYLELIRFNKKSSGLLKSTLKHYSDSIYYAAIIVEKEKEPTLLLLDTLQLFEDEYLPYYFSHVKGKNKQKKDMYSYKAFFSKIIDHCGQNKTIYISPDGLYNNINIQTLYNPETDKYLVETNDLRIVSSARGFLHNKEQLPFNYNSNTAILVGNPKFDLNDRQLDILVSAETNTRDVNFLYLDSLSRSGISELPGTEIEIHKIERLLTSFDWETSTLIGSDATEGYLKEIESPRLVHIATHGFFYGDSDKSTMSLIMGINQTYSKDPLLRSGVLLAGAQNTINGTNISDQNGILTSYEARELNLLNTELVVLSACETGVGDYVSGEGVYGLQRAVIEAGAKSVIMSLWKVDDIATQKLMGYFYTNWIEHKLSKREALKVAQLTLMKEYPSPYYWGAFVLIQD